MKMLQIIPSIYEYDTFGQFAEEFTLSEKDLIFTNRYIYDPIIAPYKPECMTLFEEDFGAGEPSDIMINAILAKINGMDYGRLIAVGGGTVIDIAKVLCVSDNTEDVNNMYDMIPSLKQRHELFIIPTTCGTGSEVTNLSIINRTKLGVKHGLGCDEMAATHAVLITEFIKTLPYEVFATSSIDALIHCIESYLSPLATNYTEMYSAAGIKQIIECYRRVVEDREAYKQHDNARKLLIASNYGGIAFGNAGCGAVHALSYALGGKYHVPHGESNHEFLMAILNFYKRKNPEGKIKKLEKMLAKATGDTEGLKGLDSLLEDILPWKRMSEYGAVSEDVPVFAKLTFDNQQRLLGKAYVSMTLEDIQAIFEECL